MIRLENISKAYRTRTGRHWVFKDVGFTIRRGENKRREHDPRENNSAHRQATKMQR